MLIWNSQAVVTLLFVDVLAYMIVIDIIFIHVLRENLSRREYDEIKKLLANNYVRQILGL